MEGTGLKIKGKKIKDRVHRTELSEDQKFKGRKLKRLNNKDQKTIKNIKFQDLIYVYQTHPFWVTFQVTLCFLLYLWPYKLTVNFLLLENLVQ